MACGIHHTPACPWPSHPTHLPCPLPLPLPALPSFPCACLCAVGCALAPICCSCKCHLFAPISFFCVFSPYHIHLLPFPMPFLPGQDIFIFLLPCLPALHSQTFPPQFTPVWLALCALNSSPHGSLPAADVLLPALYYLQTLCALDIPCIPLFCLLLRLSSSLRVRVALPAFWLRSPFMGAWHTCWAGRTGVT